MTLAHHALVVLLALSSPCAETSSGPAVALDLDADRKILDDQFQKNLEELADWCTKKRIFAARATLYEDLIRIRPDHTKARRGLGHTKDKEGVWHENVSRIKPVNWDKKAAKQFPAKRAELTTAYLDGMYTLYEKASPTLTKAEHEEWLRALLESGPDDPRIHSMRGEVQADGRWVIPETVNAKARRAEIRDAVRASIASAPKPAPGLATAAEEKMHIAWSTIREAPIARCLGTCEEAEVVRLIQATHALREVFNFCFDVEANYPSQVTMYSLAKPEEKEAFINAIPELNENTRAYLMKLDGACIEASWTLAQWAKDKAQRIDGMMRLEASWLFADAFAIDAKRGWVVEGFGLYFTRELLGTRLTWFAIPSKYLQADADHALQQRLLKEGANWMAEADAIMQSDSRPKLGMLLGKNVNKLTTPDLLYSYVLAAFLLEAKPQKVGSILKSLGEGTPAEAVFRTALNLDLVGLDERVRRWLHERK